MNVVRKAGRGAALIGRWLGYAVAMRGRQPLYADFRTWASSTIGNKGLIESDLPWFTLPAIRYLRSRIKPGWQVFEWGSGASTLFFVRRGATILSAEHDAAWAERISAQLADQPNARLLTFEGPSDAYIQAVRGGPPEGFDLIVVDGRRRLDCFREAIARVKAGALLLLDDSERPEYQSASDSVPRGWEISRFSGPKPANIWPAFSQTTLYRRPAG